MTNKSKKSSKSDLLVCKWCEKGFKSESTVATHMCVKKRRWADKDMSHIRLAYRVFQMFYEMNAMSTKPRTMEDFIRSQYYEGFTKFGRACMVNEYLNPEKYAEWLIKNGKKLADWTKDKLYDEYLHEFARKETGLRALERSIIYLTEWSEESGIEWNKYFTEVSTSRAVHDIRSSKISPWLLYNSATGAELLSRMNDEQIKMINHVIDANFWLKVFKKNTEEVDAVQEACAIAEI